MTLPLFRPTFRLWLCPYFVQRSVYAIGDSRIIPTCFKVLHSGIILLSKGKLICIVCFVNFITWLFTVENVNFHLLLYWTHIIKQGIHPSVMNPIVCSKIILQLCYTEALYGCELWNNLTKNEILLLERAHRYQKSKELISVLHYWDGTLLSVIST
jgi:hypothetical protein